MKGESVKQMRQEQYYDKMLSRLEKIETALNRIGRILGVMQQANEDSRNGYMASLTNATNAETLHKYADDEKE